MRRKHLIKVEIFSRGLIELTQAGILFKRNKTVRDKKSSHLKEAKHESEANFNEFLFHFSTFFFPSPRSSVSPPSDCAEVTTCDQKSYGKLNLNFALKASNSHPVESFQFDVREIFHNETPFTEPPTRRQVPFTRLICKNLTPRRG